MIYDELIKDKAFHKEHTSSHRLIVKGDDDTPVEIHKAFVIERSDIQTTHEEADNILAQQMFVAANEHRKGISVISDDTDVFVLLLYHYQAQNLKLQVIMESPVKKRTVVDIRDTVQRHNAIIPDLISAHAVSGCDTVASYYGIGKSNLIMILQSVYSIPAVGDVNAELTLVNQKASKFISACYGYPHCVDTMTTIRQKMWKNKVGKSSKSVQKLSSLPPTTESSTENVKRAHLQACVWKHALDPHPPELLPENYGWLRNETSETLTPVTVPECIALAPEDVLKLIKCHCESKNRVHHCGVVAIRQDLAALYFVFVKVVFNAGMNKQSHIMPEHIIW